MGVPWDQLDFVVAVLGLFGGTYGGARVSHIVRHRAEDRRDLRRRYIPELLAFFVDDNAAISSGLKEYLLTKRGADRLVESLPLPDRIQWRSATRFLPPEILVDLILPSLDGAVDDNGLLSARSHRMTPALDAWVRAERSPIAR